MLLKPWMLSRTAIIRLQLRTERHGGDAILLAVEDSGPGIGPKDADNIFDAFVSMKPQGTGLGLAICRMIVERHDGQISASPALPRGTVFNACYPSASPPCESRAGVAQRRFKRKAPNEKAPTRTVEAC